MIDLRSGLNMTVNAVFPVNCDNCIPLVSIVILALHLVYAPRTLADRNGKARYLSCSAKNMPTALRLLTLRYRALPVNKYATTNKNAVGPDSFLAEQFKVYHNSPFLQVKPGPHVAASDDDGASHHAYVDYLPRFLAMLLVVLLDAILR